MLLVEEENSIYWRRGAAKILSCVFAAGRKISRVVLDCVFHWRAGQGHAHVCAGVGSGATNVKKSDEVR